MALLADTASPVDTVSAEDTAQVVVVVPESVNIQQVETWTWPEWAQIELVASEASATIPV